MYSYPAQQPQPLQSQRTGGGVGGGGFYANQPNPTSTMQQQPILPNQTGMIGGMQNGYNQTTGYGMSNPPAVTGYQPQLQSQPTGYAGGISQPYANSNIGYNTNPTSLPQPTGMMPAMTEVSQQPPTTQAVSSNAGSSSTNQKLNIPNVRLSFITADDQLKFEQLFRSAIPPNEQALSGDKAKEILMRSNLAPHVLGDIWQLADTTKSGALLFPEFALAMYLCSIVLKGNSLPSKMPDKITNEVSSLVDIISFNIPDGSEQQHSVPQRPTNVPDFTSSQPNQSNQSNLQQLSSVLSQPTGNQFNSYQQQPLQSQQTGYQQPLQSQQTGYQQSQLTGFQQPQQTGYQQPQPMAQPTGTTGDFQQAQQTGYRPIQSQQTGYQRPVGFQQVQQPQATGYQPIQSQPTGYPQPLTAQPTGKPGQWGFINTPTTGLPGIEALKDRFMPQASGAASYSSAELQGNAKIEWAITKDEKNIYDGIFNAWDRTRNGFISGENAIEVFSQSGLNRQDLEAIWTLSDPGNKGKLDKDEFAVAMHLIYRRLNGYPIPSRLPPELVPPSSRNFSDSVSQIKTFLRSNTTGLEPAKTGNNMSYLKGRSFKENNYNNSNLNNNNKTFGLKKDATVFKNNDDDFGYKSSARHRSTRNNDINSSEKSSSDFSNSSNMSIAQLRKAIKEKQILLDAIDARDEEAYGEVEHLESRDRQAIDDLKSRIIRVQREISAHPQAPLLAGGGSSSADDRRQLLRKLNAQTDLLPQLTSSVRQIENEIAATKLEAFRLKSEKENPGSTIVGTGPNGSITESDRRKARSRAMLKAKMATLTGKQDDSATDFEKFESLFIAESDKINSEKDRNIQMFTDIEQSVDSIRKDLESSLRESSQDVENDRNVRRWDEAIGVVDEVKDFIYELRRVAPIKQQIPSPSERAAERSDEKSIKSMSPVDTGSSVASTPSLTASNQPSSEDRTARLKAEAARRMNERLAKLGITRQPKSNSSAFTPPSAEPEPLQSTATEPPQSSPQVVESPRPKPVPPKPKAKPTPPPPPAERKAAPPVQQPPALAQTPAEEELSDDDEEAELLRQRALQQQRLKKLEQEADVRKEAKKQAAEAQRQAEIQRHAELEKQKEAEESKKRQRQAEKEARLAQLRKEMQEAEERERRLLQENDEPHVNNDDSSNTGKSDEVSTPSVTTPSVSSPTESAPAAPISEPEKPAPESNNPFFKKPFTSSASSVQATTVTATPPAVHDKNPFYKYQQQNEPEKLTVVDAAAASKQRARQRGQVSDDGWGSDGNDESSDEEDEQHIRGGANPARLASILFGSMGTPSPTATPPLAVANDASTPKADEESSGDTPYQSTSSTPMPEQQSPDTIPPPPPLPTSAPPPPPLPTSDPPLPISAPPAPPLPETNGTAPAAMNLSGLLGEIEKGRALKKVSSSQQRIVESNLGRIL